MEEQGYGSSAPLACPCHMYFGVYGPVLAVENTTPWTIQYDGHILANEIQRCTVIAMYNVYVVRGTYRTSDIHVLIRHAC